ncbi:uncharacterized protein LOC134566029 [Pelobates fuscus]|uniref:uncharacterized protein LOC134566029 n=1 Tax=Pelobates fuscus TaxID=191477 RepID=UPI002FE4B936
MSLNLILCILIGYCLLFARTALRSAASANSCRVLLCLIILYITPTIKTSSSPCSLQLVQSYEDYEYFKDGDIIIGGVITVGAYAVDYTFKEHPMILCMGQSIINYYHLLNFMFGIAKINSNPSILPNITLGYHLYDSCTEPRKAVKSVLQVLSGPRRTVPNYYCMNGRSKLAGIVGDYHSITTIPIAQILGVFGYSQISYGATDYMLSNRLVYPHFFRMVQNDHIIYKIVSQILKYFTWTWVGILVSDDISGESEQLVLMDYLTSNGICVAFAVKCGMDTLKQPAEVNKIRNIMQTSSAHIIVICGSFNQGIYFFLQNEAHIFYDKTFILPPSWTSSPYLTSYNGDTLNCSLAIELYYMTLPAIGNFYDKISTSYRPNDKILEDTWISAYSCLTANSSKNTLYQSLYNVSLRDCSGEQVTDEMKLYLPLGVSPRVYYAVLFMSFALHDMHSYLNKQLNGQNIKSSNYRNGQDTNRVTAAQISSLMETQRQAVVVQQETNRLLATQIDCIMETQREDRDRLTSALQQTMLPSVTTPTTDRGRRIRVTDFLHKVSEVDDMEAYLTTFERIATREEWPPGQWAGLLAPCLSGESEKVYDDLPLSQAQDYDRLKAEILTRLGVTPAVSLPIALRKWVSQADPKDPEEMMNLTVRYQFANETQSKEPYLNAKLQDREALMAMTDKVPLTKVDKVPEVNIADTLAPHQRNEVREFVLRNRDVFAPVPGKTHVIKHDIITEPGKRVNLKPYRIPEARKEAIKAEIGLYSDLEMDDKKLAIYPNKITWRTKGNEVPRSQCSDICLPGYRKVQRSGFQACCYDCALCPAGEITNTTDSENCIKCADNEWPNNKKDTCVPRVEEFLSYSDDVLASVFIFTSVLLFIITIMILVIFIVYRDTAIVKANNKSLSFALLVSIMLSFPCVILFLGRPVDITCMLRQSSFAIIFSTAISCVLGKTVMIYIIFKATKPGSTWKNWVNRKISNFVVLIFSSFQIFINIIWLANSSPFKELDTHSYPGKIIVQCNEGSVIAFYSVLGYMGFLAAVSFVIAFLARTLPDTFNEAKYITFSMLVFCSVWIAMIPGYLSTKGKYMVAVEIFALLTSSAGLLGCIFFPKCYLILLRPEMNTKSYLIGSRNKIISTDF